MRKEFLGYYKPTDDEFLKLWTDGIFVFDTNVLLDLFRYSEDTVNTLLDVMNSIKDRIWIPYQVALEYHRNLSGIISGQVKKYTDSLNTLNEFKKQIGEKRNHPFLEPKLHEEIDEFCDRIKGVLNEKKEKVNSLIFDNPIKEKLAIILHDKIGIALKTEELEKLYEEGEKRYQKEIPPGYSDRKKPNPEKYGDLIVWYEIMKKNKEIDRPIIFITGDTKEDWFLTEMGQTIGPRPELISELRNKKDNLFYCYTTNTFLEYTKDYLDAKFDDKILDEVVKYIDSVRSFDLTQSEAELLSIINNMDKTEEVSQAEGDSSSCSIDKND